MIILSSCISAQAKRNTETVPDPLLSSFPESEEYYKSENINGEFPERIFIKTRTQTFNSYHYYILNGGLIWYKAIEGQKGPKKWVLFDGTGLPHDKSRRDFSIRIHHVSYRRSG